MKSIKLIRKLIRKTLIIIGIKKEPITTQIQKYGGKIGKGVFIGSGVVVDFDFGFLLEIEDGAVIASNSIIELHDSSLSNILGHGVLKVGKVIIKKRAYIGVSSTILPGVVIGECALVGANSLVNKSIPNGEVWAGVPIRYICKVSELDEKRKLEDNHPLCFNVDYVGEEEKLTIDYPKYKEQKILEIKKHFRRRKL